MCVSVRVGVTEGWWEDRQGGVRDLDSILEFRRGPGGVTDRDDLDGICGDGVTGDDEERVSPP